MNLAGKEVGPIELVCVHARACSRRHEYPHTGNKNPVMKSFGKVRIVLVMSICYGGFSFYSSNAGILCSL